MWMRRKGLANHFSICLKTVDNVLKLMRRAGGFNIIEGSIVLVDLDDFEYALTHRDELKEATP